MGELLAMLPPLLWLLAMLLPLPLPTVECMLDTTILPWPTLTSTLPLSPTLMSRSLPSPTSTRRSLPSPTSMSRSPLSPTSTRSPSPSLPPPLSLLLLWLPTLLPPLPTPDTPWLPLPTLDTLPLPLLLTPDTLWLPLPSLLELTLLAFPTTDKSAFSNLRPTTPFFSLKCPKRMQQPLTAQERISSSKLDNQ